MSLIRWGRTLGSRRGRRIGRRWPEATPPPPPPLALITLGALAGNTTLTRTTTAAYWST